MLLLPPRGRSARRTTSRSRRFLTCWETHCKQSNSITRKASAISSTNSTSTSAASAAQLLSNLSKTIHSLLRQPRRTNRRTVDRTPIRSGRPKNLKSTRLKMECSTCRRIVGQLTHPKPSRSTAAFARAV